MTLKDKIKVIKSVEPAKNLTERRKTFETMVEAVSKHTKSKSTKFHLDRTFSKTEKSLKKLKKSVKKTGKLLGE